jgi:hypothetical protein
MEVLEIPGDGWFVVNARDARWLTLDKRGSRCDFESEDFEFPQLGIGLHVALGAVRPAALAGDEVHHTVAVHVHQAH